MLDLVFRGAAAGTNAGLLLEKFRIAGGPKHFINRAWNVLVSKVERVGPGHALGGLGVWIARQIGGKPAEGFTVRKNFDDHRGNFRVIIPRISLSRGSRSAGSASPVRCRWRTN